MAINVWDPDSIEYWKMKENGLLAALAELEPDVVNHTQRSLRKQLSDLTPKKVKTRKEMLEEELKATRLKIETMTNPETKEKEDETKEINIDGHYIFNNDDTSIGTEQCGPAKTVSD